MTSCSRKYFFLLLFCFLPAFVLAQNQERSSPFLAHHLSFKLASLSDSVYKLPHEFIARGSERVLLDSSLALRTGVDYVLNNRSGLLSFPPGILGQVMSDSLPHRLFVSYRYLPFSFRKEYFHHRIIWGADTSGRTEKTVVSPPTRFSFDDLFGSSLRKSGSISRGFTVGSNRDLTLNSGFRMQFSGSLSADLDIVAALTDENSPIQPEGTTQTLREVDRVFIELNGRSFGATLGDFNLTVDPKQGGEFGRLFRKLQGASATARFADMTGLGVSGDAALVAATARGKFATNQIRATEGNQGPYTLTTKQGDRRLVVVAGTERVYVNGQAMTRGETKDYTIDYASGEITFTPQRLITSASRITVDFEYTDRQFNRNLVGATLATSGLGNRVKINASFFQEGDDPDSPIDISLDEATREQLRQSGADRFKAAISGVRYVGRDTVSNAPRGQYVLKDSLISGKRYQILSYAPGDDGALYAASFAFVERVPPDSIGYHRVRIGHYQATGLGKGSYLPIQFLPVPQLHRQLNTSITAEAARDLSITGEFAGSSYDRNRLSSLDDAEKQGNAFKLSARYNPKDLSIGGSSLGELDLRFSNRFVGRRFAPLDRANEIEFDRKWDLAAGDQADEEIREASMSYRPRESLRIEAGYGRMERGEFFRSERATASFTVSDSSLPRASYELENISSRNSQLDARSLWIRQRADIHSSLQEFHPGIRIEAEERSQGSEGNDSLHEGSFRFLEFAPRLALQEIGKVSAMAEVQFRLEDSSATGALQRASQSLNQIYSLQLREWNSLTSHLALNIRHVDFTGEFQSRGNLNSNVMLVRSHTRYAPLQRGVDLDLFYEFASQRSAQLERVFVRVARGIGNYRYRGDVDGNGITDESEFELTRFDGDFIVLFLPGDKLVPVVDLKTGFRARFQPSRIITQASSLLEHVARAVSTETVFRIEEKSTEVDSKRIYMLDLSRFLSDQTTITGARQFAQDLYIFENSPDLSLRLRFSERRGLLRLVSAREQSYARERSLRLRSQLVKEIGNQTEFVNRIDRVTATSQSSRERDLLSNAISSEFSYRPDPEWEVGLGVNVAQVSDRFGGGNTVADINVESIRLAYVLRGAGQLRSELQREEVVVSNHPRNSPRALPFEFTNGRVVGKTFLWQVAFDYRINQFVQVTTSYGGRSEGGRAPVHTARAEARAFF